MANSPLHCGLDGAIRYAWACERTDVSPTDVDFVEHVGDSPLLAPAVFARLPGGLQSGLWLSLKGKLDIWYWHAIVAYDTEGDALAALRQASGEHSDQ